MHRPHVTASVRIVQIALLDEACQRVVLLAPVFLQLFDHLAIFARIHHVEPRPLAGGLASRDGLPLRRDRAVEIFQMRVVQA